jgi:hypothetical protein
VVGRWGRGEESGVGRSGAGGRAAGNWGHNIEVGGGGAEVGSGVEGGDIKGGGGSAEVGSGIDKGNVDGGGAKVGHPDGAKPNFTTIRVLCWWGCSPYTRYVFGTG